MHTFFPFFHTRNIIKRYEHKTDASIRRVVQKTIFYSSYLNTFIKHIFIYKKLTTTNIYLCMYYSPNERWTVALSIDSYHLYGYQLHILVKVQTVEHHYD